MIGIFYGSTMGATDNIAERIREVIGREQVVIYDVASTPVETLNDYIHIIFGTSTWGEGGLPDDWDTFIQALDAVDLSGKKVAIFGLGDQEIFPDTFVDSIGIIYEKVTERGAMVVGSWPINGYNFDRSRAVKNGVFVGLVIDEVNQSDLTDERLKEWVNKVTAAFSGT